MFWVHPGLSYALIAAICLSTSLRLTPSFTVNLCLFIAKRRTYNTIKNTTAPAVSYVSRKLLQKLSEIHFWDWLWDLNVDQAIKMCRLFYEGWGVGCRRLETSSFGVAVYFFFWSTVRSGGQIFVDGSRWLGIVYSYRSYCYGEVAILRRYGYCL